jgi:hypothetical protein
MRISKNINWMIVSMLPVALLAAPSYAKIEPEAIVGMWLFDGPEGDIVEDVSGNGLDGNVREGIKWVEDGKFGSALEFPGLDPSYISITHGDSLSLTTFTIIAWINMEMVPDRYPVVVAKFGANRNYGIAIHKNSEAPYLQFHVGGQYNEFRTNTKVTDRQWHHVAATYDGKFVRFYVDGVPEVETAFDGAPDANDAPLTFGGGPGTSPARGIIDEVGLFSRGLTGDEINQLMADGLEKALGISAVDPLQKLATTWAKAKR